VPRVVFSPEYGTPPQGLLGLPVEDLAADFIKKFIPVMNGMTKDEGRSG